MLGYGAALELREKLEAAEKRIRELEDELNLETTWAEGEIEFWKSEYEGLQQTAIWWEERSDLFESLQCNCKPWWRYIFS